MEGFVDYYHAVASSYRLRPYPAAADFFICEHTSPAWRRYWKYLVRRGAFFHHIPGRHTEIFYPHHLPAVTESLTNAIRRAQQKEGASHHLNEKASDRLVS